MSEERTGPEPEDDLDELLGDDLDTEPDETEPEPEGEPEPEPEGEPAAEPPPQPTRAERRIRAQQRRLREIEDENRRLREAVLRQPAQPQVPSQPDPARQAQIDQAERERVAQLPFDEQLQYWRNKDREELRRENLQQALQTRDMLDRSNFQQIMRDRRLPARYATEVENLLVQARQNGMNPTREWLLKTVVGGEVLSKKDREAERQRAAGRRRVASQTTRPGGAARSTAATAGGRRGKDSAAEDEALLGGITLGELLSGA